MVEPGLDEMSEQWWTALVTSFLLLAVCFIPPVLVGLLAVSMQADLGYSDKGLGVAISTFWAVTAVASPLGGRLADRIGWPITATLGAVMASASLVLIGVLATTYEGLVAGLVVAAVGYSICSPSSNRILVRAVPRSRRGLSFGIKQSAPPAVSLAAGLAVPLVAVTFGWRMVFVLSFVMFPLIMALTLPFVRGGVDRGDDQEPRTELQGRSTRMPLAPLIVAMAFGTCAIAALTGFSMLTLVESGISNSMGGYVIAAASAVALTTRVVGGRLLDSRPAVTLWPVMWMVAGGIIGLGLLATRNPWLSAVGVVVSLSCSWGWPPMLLLIIVNGWSDSPARVTGLLQIGSGFGSAIGPLAFGFLAADFGYPWAWVAMVGVSIIAIAVLLPVQRRHGLNLVISRAEVAETLPNQGQN